LNTTPKYVYESTMSIFSSYNLSDLCVFYFPFSLQLGFYIKIFIILYADDTVIMSETEEGIQQALLNFEQYCDLWKLMVTKQVTHFFLFYPNFTMKEF
jgi:hypothetical protein